LCDPALSRDIFPDDYQTPTGAQDNTTSRPAKWMSPESLRSNVFNSASDVVRIVQNFQDNLNFQWAFGICIWELFTCGQQPYQEIAFEEMPAALAAGTRLGQPFNCPDDLYAIMYSCWNMEVFERPTPAQLQHSLEDFSQQLRKYI
jgi:hypothetical protein